MSRKLVAALILGAVACGVFGAWAAASSPWTETTIDRAVGASGILALAFAGLALLHRSWARFPLLGACVSGAVSVRSSLFTEYDPSAMNLFAYFVVNVFLVVAALLALIIIWAETLDDPRLQEDPPQGS